MAAPTGVAAAYGQVIISVYSYGAGFGIRATDPSKYPVGTVLATATDVYFVTAGQRVGFKAEAYFATDTGDETFAVVPYGNILITYTPPV